MDVNFLCAHACEDMFLNQLHFVMAHASVGKPFNSCSNTMGTNAWGTQLEVKLPYGAVSRCNKGFRARIYVNNVALSGPTRRTEMLAEADLASATEHAASYEDLARYIRKLHGVDPAIAASTSPALRTGSVAKPSKKRRGNLAKASPLLDLFARQAKPRRVVQIVPCTASSEECLQIRCYSLSGVEVGCFMLDAAEEQEGLTALRRKLACLLSDSKTTLEIVLPSGDLLQNVNHSEKPLREILVKEKTP